MDEKLPMEIDQPEEERGWKDVAQRWKEIGRQVADLGEPIYRSAGCRQCRHTGYTGRVGIYELLVANDELRHLASERVPSNVIKRAAISGGMETLRQDGWEKVRTGLTTIDEVLRVTKAD